MITATSTTRTIGYTMESALRGVAAAVRKQREKKHTSDSSSAIKINVI
jgi:hypothetical protein